MANLLPDLSERLHHCQAERPELVNTGMQLIGETERIRYLGSAIDELVGHAEYFGDAVDARDLHSAAGFPFSP